MTDQSENAVFHPAVRDAMILSVFGITSINLLYNLGVPMADLGAIAAAFYVATAIVALTPAIKRVVKRVQSDQNAV